MRKEQDSKPDFIKDLNTDILIELTKGDKLDNVAGLAGTVTELEEVKNICGLPFRGYLGKVETERPNGVVDEVVIAFEWDTPYKVYDGIEFDVQREFSAGSRLLISGKIQALKNFESGRVLVFVLADYVALSPKAMPQDDIAIAGELVYMPKHRETPRGKRITDIFVKVQNTLTAGMCYIPCICWQETADEVAGWKQGDTVELLGRYQSRDYSKKIAEPRKDTKIIECRVEWRTAYEVSVRQIRRKGEAEFEKEYNA